MLPILYRYLIKSLQCVYMYTSALSVVIFCEAVTITSSRTVTSPISNSPLLSLEATDSLSDTKALRGSLDA